MATEENSATPSLPWRVASTVTLSLVGVISKTFLTFATKKEVYGLDGFVELLDRRRDVSERERGLLTVSNHLSVVDDPVIWGLLPLRHFSPQTIRWSLGSHDICFTGSAVTTFFSLGQVLPTHRKLHSPYGGLFQPTITQCIRLLSRGPFTTPTPPHPLWPSKRHSEQHNDISDPFTDPTYTYSTTGTDVFRAPSSDARNRYSWLHIFPEGKVHQRLDRNMRYFKWGVARLILEADACPEVVPMWIEGFDSIMHEARPAPRWFPRLGRKVSITFGEPVSETVWAGFRERWKRLKAREKMDNAALGVLNNELMTGKESAELRMEVTKEVREQVLKLRRRRGWADEDPKAGVWSTYLEEGGKYYEGQMEDGSWIKDT
ncbi:hypothetical protein EJ08DRAFT_730776 [Tothia fuscella]|uniref:Tafazzin family protein n=1 Tax=Tothia fuscella TaxID=1048955 RepID=A0A9P4P0R4_9PEZI|nr:hypothetical protein EJ08DRAFT_730776 [Tothia fuscella]